MNKHFIIIVIIIVISLIFSACGVEVSSLTSDGDQDISSLENSENITEDGDLEVSVLFEPEFELDDSFDLYGEFSIPDVSFSTNLLKVVWLAEDGQILQTHQGMAKLNSFESSNKIHLPKVPSHFSQVDFIFDVIYIRGGGDVSGIGFEDAIRGGGDVSGIIIPHLLVDKIGGEWESVVLETHIDSSVDLLDFSSTNRVKIAEEFIKNLEVLENGEKVGSGNFQKSSPQIATYPATETGQSDCYNGNGFPVDCSGTGQDGEISAEWEFELSEDTVFDPLVNLSWEKFASQADPMSFDEASDFCEQRAMRIPSLLEFRTIIDFGAKDVPNIRQEIIFFSNGLYWTSNKKDQDTSFVINTSHSCFIETISKTDLASVFCVKGLSIDLSSFPIENNVDTASGLSWHLASDNMTWELSLAYCNSQTKLGADDWRLANIAELSLIGNRGYIVEDDEYWSSTTYIAEPQNAWILLNGKWEVKNKSASHKVACVRILP